MKKILKIRQDIKTNNPMISQLLTNFFEDLTQDSCCSGKATHRVREIIKVFTTKDRKKVQALLPLQAQTCPTLTTFKYPNALLAVLPAKEKYALLGIITEDLLKFDSEHITVENLCVLLKDTYKITPDLISKVQKSKTTPEFLKHLIQTRIYLDEIRGQQLFLYDQELKHISVDVNITGHPDIITKTRVFEIKVSGCPEKNWLDFMFQLFAYGSMSESKDLYLVLPLQETVWYINTSEWQKKLDYIRFFESFLKPKIQKNTGDFRPGMLLREQFSIGNHTSKEKSLFSTVVHLVEKEGIERPFQVFLAGNQTSKMNIPDEDLIQTGEFINQTSLRLFIHSQYIINLCAEPFDKDDYHVKTLVKNLEYGKIIGSKGVVVHVGKYTDKPLEIAMQNMRNNLLRAMEFATEECPILLETPAGQGTETLTKLEDFFEFVESFQDTRIQICVDTCHVFSLGYDSLEYIKTISELNPTIIKVVHFNDSSTACGSHVDRHAFIGTGNIGIQKMHQIAEYCSSKNYPMIIE